MVQVADSLRSLISSSRARHLCRSTLSVKVGCEVNFVNGELERIRVVENAGCGIRVLVDGWGFTSTSNISHETLKESLSQAISAVLTRLLRKTRSKDSLNRK